MPSDLDDLLDLMDEGIREWKARGDECARERERAARAVDKVTDTWIDLRDAEAEYDKLAKEYADEKADRDQLEGYDDLTGALLWDMIREPFLTENLNSAEDAIDAAEAAHDGAHEEYETADDDLCDCEEELEAKLSAPGAREARTEVNQWAEDFARAAKEAGWGNDWESNPLPDPVAED